jgi:dethiobiotin synthetase
MLVALGTMSPFNSTAAGRIVARNASEQSRRARPRPTKCSGLFVVGTDTAVGKTFVAARIAAAMARIGLRVGVYKPAASGCRRIGRLLVSDDAVALWEAAGRPGELKAVCPQRFAAPLAPHLAAKEERKEIDSRQLRRGIDYWQRRSDVVIVEGAGGLMSPVGDHDYVADLAADFGFPLVVVVPNRIGAINSTLLTLIAAASRPQPLSIAGIVLNDVLPPSVGDPATHSNRLELELRCVPPVLTELRHDAVDFDAAVDWLGLARRNGVPGVRY